MNLDINLIKEVERSLDADSFVYDGPINDIGLNKIINLTKETNKTNALLVLRTYGGDPDCGYKIAKRMQQKYDKFFLCVPGYCKSAGTLIAIGSDLLIMTDTGELGPLDAQVMEKDEFSHVSSLNIMESIDILTTKARSFFWGTTGELIKIFSGRTSLKIATTLTQTFISSSLSQIELSRIGEIQRAISIAYKYGERLITPKRGNISNLKNLFTLITGYPSHGFVIDIEEVKRLFKEVRSETETESDLIENLTKEMDHYAKKFPNELNVNRLLIENNEGTDETTTKSIQPVINQLDAGKRKDK